MMMVMIITKVKVITALPQIGLVSRRFTFKYMGKIIRGIRVTISERMKIKCVELFACLFIRRSRTARTQYTFETHGLTKNVYPKQHYKRMP